MFTSHYHWESQLLKTLMELQRMHLAPIRRNKQMLNHVMVVHGAASVTPAHHYIHVGAN